MAAKRNFCFRSGVQDTRLPRCAATVRGGLLATALCALLACSDGAERELPEVDASREAADPDDEVGRDAARTADASASDARIRRDGSPPASSDRADASLFADASKGDASAAPSEAGRSDAAVARDGSLATDGSVQTDAGGIAFGKKFVGNITTRGQVRPDFATFWNQITPENEGKWGTVEPVRNQMNWSGLDRIYEFSKRTGVIHKAHTLVWGSQQPSWLASLSRAEQAAEVEEWIRLFCERYPDVAMIDVVNEPPPHTTPVYLEALGGAGASGYDWIVQSFKLARKYCPKAILMLNDYNNIEYGGDNTRFIAIVQAIKQAGAPIDAVGAQAHDAFKLPVATVKQLLDKLASETKLPVYITEYDLDIADDAQQRHVMEAQFPLFWEHPNVAGITLWGYVSGATWRPNTGLMSESGAQRPAMTWLVNFLKSQPRTPSP